MNSKIKCAILAFMTFFSLAAHAQETYAPLLLPEFANPFISPQQTLDEADKLSSEIKLAFDALEIRERKLLETKSQLSKYGYTAETYYFAVRNLAQQGKFDELNLLLQRGSEEVAPLFAEFANFVRDTLDVTMAFTYHKLRADIAALPEKQRNQRWIKDAFLSIERDRQKYIENRHQYGESKDTLRTTPFNSFFIKSKNLYLTEFERESLATRIANKFRAIGGLFLKLPLITRLLPDLASAIRTITRVRQPNELETPITATVGRIVKKVGDDKDIEVVVEGRENLPTENRPNEINLYIASHRHAFLDQLTLANLGLDKAVFFAAVNNFTPNSMNKFFKLKDKLIEKLNLNYGLIVVGKGSDPDPIQKSLLIVENSPVRSFIIFPGGRLPDGLGATMGIRQKFFDEEGLIAAFEKAGYKVNLIPISMRDNASLFDMGSLTNSERVTIRVHPMIDDATRKIFKMNGRTDSLGMLLHYGLLDDLVTNSNLMWGQVRPSRIMETVSRYLNGARSCKEVFQ